jgi:hypothetical protein
MPTPFVSEIPALQAKAKLLPQMMQQQQQKKFQEQQIGIMESERELAEQRFGFEQEQAALKKKAARKGMGLEAGKLGMTMATGGMGGTTFGDIGSSIKSFLPGGSAPAITGRAMKMGVGEPMAAAAKGGGGFFSKVGGALGKVPIGSMLGGGLMGYGVGKMLGEGKSDLTKFGLGFGAGGLMSLLGGGGLMGGLTGGLFGGLGGLFG